MTGDLDRSTALRSRLADAAPIGVSRVTTARCDELIDGLAVVRLPVVWGRTVWTGFTGLCLVEHPNGLGALERDLPAAAEIVITGTASTPAPAEALDLTGGDVGSTTAALRAARALRGRLMQIPGIDPVVSAMESARFVLLFPLPPQIVLDVPAPVGVAVDALGIRLPEYAGGVRFDLAAEAVESEVVAYAESLHERLRLEGAR